MIVPENEWYWPLDKSPNYTGKDIGIATMKRYHTVRADCMLYMDYVTTCHNYKYDTLM